MVKAFNLAVDRLNFQNSLKWYNDVCMNQFSGSKDEEIIVMGAAFLSKFSLLLYFYNYFINIFRNSFYPKWRERNCEFLDV